MKPTRRYTPGVGWHDPDDAPAGGYHCTWKWYSVVNLCVPEDDRMDKPIKPRVLHEGVPLCHESCPAFSECHDAEPDTVCEPAVRDLSAEVNAWRKHSDAGCDPDIDKELSAAVARTDAWRERAPK